MIWSTLESYCMYLSTLPLSEIQIYLHCFEGEILWIKGQDSELENFFMTQIEIHSFSPSKFFLCFNIRFWLFWWQRYSRMVYEKLNFLITKAWVQLFISQAVKPKIIYLEKGCNFNRTFVTTNRLYHNLQTVSFTLPWPAKKIL